MMHAFFKRLRHDSNGAAIIEFAVLAPAIIAMLIGVFQIAINMQAINALRGIASDTARYAVVEYMKKNEVTDAQIKAEAERIGKASPYLLNDTLTATVTSVATPRMQGSFEKTLRLTYQPPDVLPLFPWDSPESNFERPIFVIDE